MLLLLDEPERQLENTQRVEGLHVPLMVGREGTHCSVSAQQRLTEGPRSPAWRSRTTLPSLYPASVLGDAELWPRVRRELSDGWPRMRTRSR